MPQRPPPQEPPVSARRASASRPDSQTLQRTLTDAVPATTVSARASDESQSILAGIFVAIAVHVLVAGVALRLNRREGNVARTSTQPAQEQVIETHLLRGGGANMDPRRVVHRVTPTLAEREAPRQVAISRDPTQVQLAPDAGAQDYMNAIITGRRRQARGNQDLAELERITAMAAAEQAADPTLTGEGVPGGSRVGDTDDPALATRGAATKIDEFLREHIRVTTALTGTERRTVTFRIRLDESGTIDSASIHTASGNDALDADILTQAQGLAENHARISTLTPEELAQVAGRNINVNVPIAQMGH